jgi:hypothetical protein
MDRLLTDSPSHCLAAAASVHDHLDAGSPGPWKKGKSTRGNRALPKPVCDPWRAGETVPELRSWSSFVSGIRASSSAYAGSVGKCA